MRGLPGFLLRLALVFSLAFAPVANALNMAAMAVQETIPLCHTPDRQAADRHAKPGCCGGAAHQCHCAMATTMPASNPFCGIPVIPADHPQTVLRLDLENAQAPETPPPRQTL